MKSLEEQIGGKCIHFNGLMSGTCKAGVVYESFRVKEETLFQSIPCIRGNMTKCDKCQFPTAEDVATKLKEITQQAAKTLGLLAAIKEHYQKTKKTSGQIPCPTCGHPAGYVVAPTNGHIWAMCKTCNISFNE